MRSPIEIELQMAGSVINVIQRVSPITIQLLKALYVPLTLTLISGRTKRSPMTLRISYDYLPDLIKESLISSSTAKLPAINAITNGESTPG